MSANAATATPRASGEHLRAGLDLRNRHAREAGDDRVAADRVVRRAAAPVAGDLSGGHVTPVARDAAVHGPAGVGPVGSGLVDVDGDARRAAGRPVAPHEVPGDAVIVGRLEDNPGRAPRIEVRTLTVAGDQVSEEPIVPARLVDYPRTEIAVDQVAGERVTRARRGRDVVAAQ